MSESLLVALLSLAGTLAGTVGGLLMLNRLTVYRIGELEKKVDKHNRVVERMAVAERDLVTVFRYIDDLRGK